ncbi:MAG: HD domain-containing protein [Candidatus Omnitrophica bacterium]|nr:HD domain-containing protein [Candidatus Omnitrophota bacterium]
MRFCLKEEDQRLLKSILDFSRRKNKKLYLVGGYLRDILLKREKNHPDIDFCLNRGAISFAKDLQKKLKSGFVILDRRHPAARLVKKIKDKTYTLDFTDFRGKTLEEDLRHRDFTINTLVLELDKVFSPYPKRNFFDFFHAQEDLKEKVIRMVNPCAFDEDPLRILRAFSFASTFNFKIDKETLRQIKLKKNKLSSVSFERIRDELFKIFQNPSCFDYVLELDKLRILEIILPEIKMMRGVSQGPYHHLDVWQHSLETLRQLEMALWEFRQNKDLWDYLDVVISHPRKRLALLKLGALLHDIGKPKARRRQGKKIIFHGHERIGFEITKNVIQRLRLSNVELDALAKMILCHLRPGYLADNETITPRARFRFFRDAGDEAVSVLLISLADQRSTKGPLTTRQSRLRHEKTVFSLIKEYFKKKENRPRRLINGDDLIKRFKLAPSPLIGKILREVEELQAIGRIKTKKEAFQVARKFI